MQSGDRSAAARRVIGLAAGLAASLVAGGIAPTSAPGASFSATSNCLEHQAFVDGDDAAVAARLPKRYTPVRDGSSGRPLLFVRALRCQAVTLDVKALPPGAPADFGGAVGNFTLAAEAKPKSAQVGDPFTVTATITGRGNFGRVTAPTFEDESGWHKYPPSSEFKQDDDVGISGTKKFETVLSANEGKDKIPAQLFSYFDPAKEQYVTLRAEPIPVRVEGGTAPRTAAAPAPQAPTNAPSAASRTATQQQIIHQLTELPAETQSFTPLFARRTFWPAQLIPLVALLGLIAWRIRLAHLNNRELQRREALQHEPAALQRSLHREDVSPEDYFSRASRAVQLKTALLQNVDPNSVDADVAASAFRMDEATRVRLRRLFEKSDEARYSGAGNGIRLLPAEARNEVLELIDNLRT